MGTIGRWVTLSLARKISGRLSYDLSCIATMYFEKTKRKQKTFLYQK